MCRVLTGGAEDPDSGSINGRFVGKGGLCFGDVPVMLG